MYPNAPRGAQLQSRSSNGQGQVGLTLPAENRRFRTLADYRSRPLRISRLASLLGDRTGDGTFRLEVRAAASV